MSVCRDMLSVLGTFVFYGAAFCHMRIQAWHLGCHRNIFIFENNKIFSFQLWGSLTVEVDCRRPSPGWPYRRGASISEMLSRAGSRPGKEYVSDSVAEGESRYCGWTAYVPLFHLPFHLNFLIFLWSKQHGLIMAGPLNFSFLRNTA